MPLLLESSQLLAIAVSADFQAGISAQTTCSKASLVARLHCKQHKAANVSKLGSLRAQTALRGVVVLRGGVDNEVPQLHSTLFESLDYKLGYCNLIWYDVTDKPK